MTAMMFRNEFDDPPTKTYVINVRIPKWLLMRAYKLVEDGKFVSLSELVRYGLRLVIEQFEKHNMKSK